MRLTRRRFMALSAGLPLAGPARAENVQTWRGQAFGAAVSLRLTGPAERIGADLPEVVARMRELEAAFSLFSPDGAMARLNRDGRLALDGDWRALLAEVARVHRATEGLFDPTIQPLWRALSEGRAPDASVLGFDRVELREEEIVLAPGQALSLNGIAQGFAADQVAALLTDRGYAKALIDMGEQRALGGPFRLAIEDPIEGPIGRTTLRNSAVATSSPGAMEIGGRSHILHPKGGAPLWSTVSVSGPKATLCDGASTGFCLMTFDQIARAKADLGLGRILLVDWQGDVQSL